MFTSYSGKIHKNKAANNASQNQILPTIFRSQYFTLTSLFEERDLFQV